MTVSELSDLLQALETTGRGDDGVYIVIHEEGEMKVDKVPVLKVNVGYEYVAFDEYED